MKLVQILARELKEWPDKAQYADQDDDREVRFGPGSTEADFFAKELADEDVGFSCYDGIPWAGRVTRADWEAEKARIAGKVDGGWKRHRGGKCPVEAGTLVDVRYRDGVIHYGTEAIVSADCAESNWVHEADKQSATASCDIMAYRIHKPAEQPAIEPAVVENVQAFNAQAEMLYDPVAQGPIQWRNRIRELDTQRAELEATYQRQIGEVAKERGELVERLASEGLALVEVAVQAVDPDFDAEDKSTWRVCDVVEIVSSDNRGWLTRKDMQGQLNYDSTMYSGGWYIKFDDAGDWCVSDNTELKFHSRPAS